MRPHSEVLAAKAPNAGRILDTIETQGRAMVIVELARQAGPTAIGHTPAEIDEFLEAIRSLQSGFKSEHPSIFGTPGRRIRASIHQPVVALSVDRAELDEIAADPRVKQIHEDLQRVGTPGAALMVGVLSLLLSEEASTGGGPPDLIVASPSVSDTTPATDQAFTVSATVKNQGSGNSASTTLRYFRSTNSTISTLDTQLATDPLVELIAGGGLIEAATVSISTPGTFWIGACVDPVGGESNTANNCSTGVQITVQTPTSPDLVVVSPSVSDTTPAMDQVFTVSATVQNQGSGNSASTTLRYFRSTNSTISTLDTQLATDAVTSLVAGGSSIENATASISTAGTFWLGACVDAVPDESPTTNNCSAGVQVTVSSMVTVTRQLQVRHYTTSNITNTEADAILAGGSSVLQTNDGFGDVACAVTLQRDGNVTAFTTGDGSINSLSEVNAVLGLAGNVKIVNQINWCGSIGINIIGCAPVPGTSFIVVRFIGNSEGILWAHEFGHNKGLGHRNDTNAVMNSTISSTRREVNQTECDAFRTLPAIATALNPAIVHASQVIVQSQQVGTDQIDIRSFVRQIFIHGVSYEEAIQYDSSAVATLLEMLNDPAEQASWSNIVVVMGMIGDQQAVDPLIAFIEGTNGGVLSPAHYTAKTSALMSLGYLINKTGNRQALDYLRKSVDPQTWAGSQVGIAPFQANTTERDFNFSQSAVLGLALSGRPEAGEILNSLQQPAATDSASAFQAQKGELISDALKEHTQISRDGLIEYYR